MTDFAYETDIELRYADLDPAAHVNNAVYVSYLEQARIEYLQDVMELTLSDLGLVVAHLEIDYLQTIEWGAEISIGVRVTEIGTKSFGMEYEVRTDGEVAATAETVQVAVDLDGSGTRPIPEGWRERIEAHEPHL